MPGAGRSRHGAVGPARKVEGKPCVADRRQAGQAQGVCVIHEARHHPEDEAARFVRLRDRYGYDAFKWRVGAECGRDVDEWPGRTEAVVPTVARALGDGIANSWTATAGSP